MFVFKKDFKMLQESQKSHRLQRKIKLSLPENLPMHQMMFILPNVIHPTGLVSIIPRSENVRATLLCPCFHVI